MNFNELMKLVDPNFVVIESVADKTRIEGWLDLFDYSLKRKRLIIDLQRTDIRLDGLTRVVIVVTGQEQLLYTEDLKEVHIDPGGGQGIVILKRVLPEQS